MDWKTMLAYMTGSVDEELLRRNEYLAAENRILRAHLPGRVPLRDGERRTLAQIGKRLGRKALAEIASVVRPETILAWHRRLVAALLHESSLARTMPTDRILTCRCDTTLVGRVRSSDSRSHSRGRPHSPARLGSGRADHLR